MPPKIVTINIQIHCWEKDEGAVIDSFHTWTTNKPSLVVEAIDKGSPCDPQCDEMLRIELNEQDKIDDL